MKTINSKKNKAKQINSAAGKGRKEQHTILQIFALDLKPSAVAKAFK